LLTPRSEAVLDLVRRYAPLAFDSDGDWSEVLDALGIQREFSNPFDLIEAVGTLAGLRDQLYLRRDRLWMSWDRRSRNFSRLLSHVVPVDRLVGSMVDAYKSVTEEKTLTKNQRAAAKAAAVALLHHTLQTDNRLNSELQSMTREALAEGRAEGYTSGAALGALKAGRKVPNLDNFKQDALMRIGRVGDQSNSSEAVTHQIDGLAGDLAIAVAAAIKLGVSNSDIESEAEDTLAAGDGNSFFLDSAIHSSFVAGQLAQYQQDSVQYANFTTVGDDKTCVLCMSLEAGNPYPIADVPEPPQHGSCRCWIEPADGP
jgi:hypothetical protein